jgi:cell division transport system ATP-binding protein
LIEFQEAGYAAGAAEILRDVTFAVGPGALCVLMGGPGAGKTTVLRLCLGEIAPSSGQVLAFGAPVPVGNRTALARLRRRIGLIERDPVFLDHASVRDNAAAPLVAAGIDPEERGRDIDELLAWTGIAAMAAARPCALDAAARRRLALARAVVGGAEVILADDPTAGLAPEPARSLVRHLDELNAMGRTLLVATADAETAAALAHAGGATFVHLEAGAAEPVA